MNIKLTQKTLQPYRKAKKPTCPVLAADMTENNLPAEKKKSKKTTKAITGPVTDKAIEATKEPFENKEVAVKKVGVVKKKKK